MKNLQFLLQNIDSLHDFVRDNPLPRDFEVSLENDFAIEYTYNTNAIEGNTLNFVETKVVLEGITIGGKSLREHFEVINHIEALDFVKELVASKMPLSQKLICNIHALILRNINNREAGRYRTNFVSVGGFFPPQPYLVPSQMEQFIEKYHSLDIHPVLKASFVHLEFVRIHPFIDGNGRTARLLMNLELLKRGYLPINILFAKKSEYYEAIRQYSNLNLGTEVFDNLLAEYVLESLQKRKELILDIKNLQISQNQKRLRK